MVLEKKDFRVNNLEQLYNQQVARQATEGMDAFEIAAAAVGADLIPTDVLNNAGLRGAKKKGRKGRRGEVKPGRGGVGHGLNMRVHATNAS